MNIRRQLTSIIDRAGMPLVYAGALMLIGGYAFNITNMNSVLIAAAIFVVAGTVLHVRKLKKESKY